MNNTNRAIASKFTVYSNLGWLDQWKFLRSLKWAAQDAASLELLLDFEKELEEKSFITWQIFELLIHALSWYNREDHDDRLPNRLTRDRLPEMLQVVLIFLARGKKLHYKYRALMLNIINTSGKVGGNPKDHPVVTPEQFRRKATQSISNTNDRWSEWDRWYPHLETGANHLLNLLANIAGRGIDPNLFDQYRLEAAKAFSNTGWSIETLRYLERIAEKVVDTHSYSSVFQDVTPVIGLETTAALMGICKDYQEFEVVYPRIAAQLISWGTDFVAVFRKAKNTSELNRLFVFLDTLPKNARLAIYTLYSREHHKGSLPTIVSGALLGFKHRVFDACYKGDWQSDPDYDRVVDGVMDEFDEHIVSTYLNKIWTSTYKTRDLQWEFNKFTEYIPYAMISWDWTKDNEKARPYWNSRAVEDQEYHVFIAVLEFRLLSIYRKMELSDLEALFELLPAYLDIQAFTKPVKVPVEWVKDIVFEEAYDKWAGNYTQQVDVARPKSFAMHRFSFERPDVQNAVDLLDDMDKIRDAIQAYKNTGH